MAWRFPTRFPRRCYFPTVHVHDGEEPERATYDHALFAQTTAALQAASEPSAPELLQAIERSAWYPHEFMLSRFPDRNRWLDIAENKGVLARTEPVYHKYLGFWRRNQDEWFDLSEAAPDAT